MYLGSLLALYSDALLVYMVALNRIEYCLRFNPQSSKKMFLKMSSAANNCQILLTNLV